MDKINSTVIALNDSFPLILPLFERLHFLFDFLKWLLGGLFGLYLIFMLLRWNEVRKTRIIMEKMLEKISSLDTRVKKIEKGIEWKNSKNGKNKNREIAETNSVKDSGWIAKIKNGFKRGTSFFEPLKKKLRGNNR